MKPRSEKHAWERVLPVAAAAAAIVVSAIIQPVEAKDYTRSCRATLEVRVAGTQTARKSYRWSVSKTVSGYHPNAAREDARRAIVTCMQTHWEARNADAAPSACQSYGSIVFNRYPFGNLAEQLRDDYCPLSHVNPADVALVLFIEGDTGCVVDGGNINPATRVDIASSYQIHCPVSEGSSWECVGEGCHPPLPGIRLPGHDISDSATPGEDWRHCQQRCEDTPACRAWTWRRPGTSGAGSPEHCLLKSEAGARVSDSCCNSGIKD